MAYLSDIEIAQQCKAKHILQPRPELHSALTHFSRSATILSALIAQV